MLERIRVRKEEIERQEKYVNVDLWMGISHKTLNNYKWHSLEQVESAIYKQIGRGLKFRDFELTIIIIRGDAYNRSIKVTGLTNLGTIHQMISEFMTELEADWAVVR